MHSSDEPTDLPEGGQDPRSTNGDTARRELQPDLASTAWRRGRHPAETEATRDAVGGGSVETEYPPDADRRQEQRHVVFAQPPGATQARFTQQALELAFIGSLLFLAWVIPVTAIVVVWPLLFLVPGWLLVARVLPSLGPAGRLGLGVVVSVVGSAHLANVVAYLEGSYGSRTVFAVAALVAVVAYVLARWQIRHLAPPPTFSRVALRDAVRRDWPGLAMGLTAVLVVGFVLAGSAWRQVDGSWVSGGWNWSDFLVHVAIGSSLGAGNYPPEVPYFVGEPLSYHWFADFHGSITALSAGIEVIPVFILSNALMAGAFTVLVWQLAITVLGDRRAGLPAAAIAMFGGGLGWIRLVGDLTSGAADLPTLLSTTAYDNTWADDPPLFRIASVLGTGFLTHRATAFGLPILVGAVLVWRLTAGRRPGGVLLAGSLAALMAPFHFFFLPATYLIVGLDFLARRHWRTPGWLRDAVLFLAPAVAALPFIVGPISLQQGSGALRLVAGWSEAPFENGPLATVFFYTTNLGLPLALAAFGAFRGGLEMPTRAWLIAWAVALFLVPNLVVASAVPFDMNKYFQVMAVALALLGGWLIRSWPAPALALAVAATAISPLLVSIWHVANTTSVVMSAPQERAARWIAENTPRRATFATDAYINSPVDLAGRLRITSFGPYVANLGFDSEEREADVKRIYCDGDEVAREVMAKYGATLVLSSGGNVFALCGDRPGTDFASSPLFETVYDVDGVAVWQLRG